MCGVTAAEFGLAYASGYLDETRIRNYEGAVRQWERTTLISPIEPVIKPSS